MLTRMEITYKSKKPCDVKPEIFTTGGYSINVGGRVVMFDFEDMEANVEFKDGYLFIYVLQKNFDECLLGEYSLTEADELIRAARKEDFTEIYYECSIDVEGVHPIELAPLSITFYDYSTSGTGEPMIVSGEMFSGLNEG